MTVCRPFDMAVRIAYLTAKRGQNVLLSPASASFDAFKSYEERGERFAEMLSILAKETSKNHYGVIAGGEGETYETE